MSVLNFDKMAPEHGSGTPEKKSKPKVLNKGKLRFRRMLTPRRDKKLLGLAAVAYQAIIAAKKDPNRSVLFKSDTIKWDRLSLGSVSACRTLSNTAEGETYVNGYAVVVVGARPNAVTLRQFISDYVFKVANVRPMVYTES
jgi:hypothetical protein